MDFLPRKRVMKAQALYFLALLKRFRITFLMLLVLVFGGGALLHVLLLRAGRPVGLGRSIVAAYFLLFAQPIIDIPDNGAVELLAVLIPPLGITTVAEGLVRFAYLFFAKTRNDKEWVLRAGADPEGSRDRVRRGPGRLPRLRTAAQARRADGGDRA